MKIITLPDLHDFGIKQLPLIADDLRQANVVILVGDLTNSGTAIDAARVIDAVRQFNHSILAVPGNWDGGSVDAYLTKSEINLHGRIIVKDGFVFMGVGGSLPSFGATPNEIPEWKFEQILEETFAQITIESPIIFVAHQPPINTHVDTAFNEIHIGSHMVRQFIEQHQPILCLTGHVHEGTGIDTIGETQIVNPGPIWQGKYGYIEIISQQVSTIEIREFTPLLNTLNTEI